MEDFDKRVGANVQTYRTAEGMSQADLASALSERGEHVHQQTIQKIEKGTRPLRFAEAVRLSRVLNMPVADLYDEPTSARADAALLHWSRILSEKNELVKELARQLADDLVRLTWELALNRARKPEDQAPPNRVKGAAGWLERPWGEQLSESLLAAILDHSFVEDIRDELSTTTDTVQVLKDLASIKVGLPEKKARTHESEA